MTIHSWSPQDVRRALLLKSEIALVDLRSEADFATGHPLFAAQFPLATLEAEAALRIPRLATPVILYGIESGRCRETALRLQAAGYGQAGILQGGLEAWREAGYEVFTDVNSPSKAFGELVEARRHTPSIAAASLNELLSQGAPIAILDARRPDEFLNMCIPGGRSVPGAELVLRARAAAPDPNTMIVVNCAGRTRSIIGAQSLLNAGIPNPVRALRNGTIGWLLARLELAQGADTTPITVSEPQAREAAAQARDVAYRAGVRRIDLATLEAMEADPGRTLYCFDVRGREEYAAGHPRGFLSVPGGQLVQETDHHAAVRGARIVLYDDQSARADMTASWLAQSGWEVFTLEASVEGRMVFGAALPAPRPAEGRYRRPYEGTGHDAAVMQAYLDWEYGLVAQLQRDGTHGFYVI